MSFPTGTVPILVAVLMAAPGFAQSTAPAPTSSRSEMIVTDADRRHWSYLPLSNPPLPPVHAIAAARTPIDRFILARLETNHLAPSPTAGARTLVRRIHFDLLGLPPTPAQTESFVRDFATDPSLAVASLVDRLLASPHYGERWARHWLDVVRYADSDGQESDADRPTAHHYRDFVIRSLNGDLPFDTFVRWQLAGDELEPDNPQAIAATGFIVAGTHAVLPDTLMEEERIRTRFNELDDMISTTGSALMGLTLGCARCHDHKYDPVPKRDYYRMLSAFNGGDRAQVPLVPMEEVRRHREREDQWRKDLELAKKQLGDGKNIPEGERADWDRRARAVKALEAGRPEPLPAALAFADFGAQPRETFLLARGDLHAKGESVELGFLTALTRGRTAADYWTVARVTSHRPDSTQQRRAMAEWMTDPDHGAGALVARVIVNRVWQHHFGQGLVRTVNDFGTRCDPPTHPELLEWLTAEFVKGGWKLKPLHRLIMNSSAYLQDTTYAAEKANVDPDNRLLWRRRPLRIESEILRDAMLAVSGTMNPQMAGPAVKAPIPAEAIQARNMKDPYPADVKDSPATRRRSLYLFHKRVVQQPLMQAFDGPDAQASCGRRENTTVAPQALALLNDSFVRARARDFAERVEHEAGSGIAAQVRLAWRLALGRDPSDMEQESGTAFVAAQIARRSQREPGQSPDAARSLALADLCQSLFALNEFLYID